MSVTRILMPRMQGRPPHLPGSTVMRLSSSEFMLRRWPERNARQALFPGGVSLLVTAFESHLEFNPRETDQSNLK